MIQHGCLPPGCDSANASKWTRKADADHKVHTPESQRWDAARELRRRELGGTD